MDPLLEPLAAPLEAPAAALVPLPEADPLLVPLDAEVEEVLPEEDEEVDLPEVADPAAAEGPEPVEAELPLQAAANTRNVSRDAEERTEV